VEDRVIRRQVDDRILHRGKHLANLCLPHLPGIGSPEVVHPEKAALQQVRLERLGILGREEQTADLLHQDDRTLVQLLAVQANDEMVRLPGGVLADGDLRQFRDANRQVDVCKRVVREPVAAVSAGMRPIDGPAVVELPVVRVRSRQMRFDAVTPEAELRPPQSGYAERRGHEDRDEPEPHDERGLC